MTDVVNHPWQQLEYLPPTLLTRFRNKVPVLGQEDCWLWQGSLTARGGYGQIMSCVGGIRKLHKAHRLSLELYLGRPLDEGTFVCHTCHTPACCNPKHLYEGTAQDNWDDTIEAGNNYVLPILRGESSPSAKLTRSQALRVINSQETGAHLARIYGVSRAAISKIRRGKAWKELHNG